MGLVSEKEHLMRDIFVTDEAEYFMKKDIVHMEIEEFVLDKCISFGKVVIYFNTLDRKGRGLFSNEIYRMLVNRKEGDTQ